MWWKLIQYWVRLFVIILGWISCAGAPTQTERLILLLGLGRKSSPQVPQLPEYNILPPPIIDNSLHQALLPDNGFIDNGLEQALLPDFLTQPNTIPTQTPRRKRQVKKCSHRPQCLKYWDESRGTDKIHRIKVIYNFIYKSSLLLKTIDAKSSSLKLMAASQQSLAALCSLLQLPIASVLVQSYLLSSVVTLST